MTMDYKKMKLDKLKELCTSFSLPTDGRREDLIRRLIRFELSKSKQLNFNNLSAETQSNDSKETKQVVVNETDSTNTMETNAAVLLIKVKYSNLDQYFNAGIIYPLTLEQSQVYKNENRKEDFFTATQDFIPLLSEPFGAFLDDDAYLQIFKDGLEVRKTEIEGFYLSDAPLPISRVQKIIFKKVDARRSFLASAKTFPDYFVPASLCDVQDLDCPTKQLDFAQVKFPKNETLDIWKVRLLKFDKILGMFSYMKNVGVMYAESLNQYQEYTMVYFLVASLINDKLSQTQTAKDPGSYKFLLYPSDNEIENPQRAILRAVLDVVYSSEEFSIEKAQTVISQLISFPEISQTDLSGLKFISNFLPRLKDHQVVFNDIFRAEPVKKNYPLIALVVLARFSNKNRQHTDKQAVRLLFINNQIGLSKALAEYLLAVLGLYYGYKSLIKADTNLKFQDPVFERIADLQQSIKFRLESRLERVLIESVMEWTLNEKPLSNDYLLYPPIELPKISLGPITVRSLFEYEDRTTNIVGTSITIIERRSQQQSILDVVARSYPNTVSGKSFLLNYMVQNFGVSKDMLLEMIKTNISKSDFSKIMKIIEIDN
jgi:hypothetical protein